MQYNKDLNITTYGEESMGGKNNDNLETSRTRLIQGSTYQNLSTVWVTPIPNTPAMVPAKAVFGSWMNIMTPMNQAVYKLPIFGMEVGDAYNKAVETILEHPQLSKSKYMLTVEWDNLPPPDGLLRLYESMDKYDVVGGLYWTKGEFGQPMIYGDPNIHPRNYIPQVPIPDSIQRCNGLGMGFTLFKLSMFKKIEKPWFKTLQQYDPQHGSSAATQDLYFFDKAAKHGYKFASDNRIKVGHMDVNTGEIW